MLHASVVYSAWKAPWRIHSFQLQVRLDGICKELEGSRGAQLELKAYYQSRIKEIHSRTDSYRLVTHVAAVAVRVARLTVVCCTRRTKQGECDAEHDKLTGLQAQLERRLLELEQEAQCQHDQLLADFDQVFIIVIWAWPLTFWTETELYKHEVVPKNRILLGF